MAVYKLFSVRPSKNEETVVDLFSPVFSHCQWKLGSERTEELSIPVIDEDGAYSVNKGLHSCLTIPVVKLGLFVRYWYIGGEELFSSADKECNKGIASESITKEVILKCTVPKGAAYYVTEKGVVVSDRLIVDNSKRNRKSLETNMKLQEHIISMIKFN